MMQSRKSGQGNCQHVKRIDMQSLGRMGARARDIVGGGLAAHIEISMLVEHDATGGFRHGITDVGIGGDSFCFDLTRATPFQQGKITNVHPRVGTFCGSTGIDHEDSTGIINQDLCRVLA